MLTSDLTIPAGIELTIYNGFIVDEGVTLTFSADNKIKFGADGNATQGYLFVDGKVIDNSRKLESAEQTNMLFEVKIVTGEGRETVNTYTTLKNALSETTSGTIYLYNDVKVEGTLTIPENVTVQYSEDANSEASVIMMDKSILNVNGVLFLDGKHGLKADVDAEEYTVNSYNIIKAAEQTAGFETIKVDIAGAWFVAALGDDEDTYQNFTSIAVAAENSASLVDYPTITIMGTVSMGTVTFTAPEDTILTINIDNDADMGGNQKATGDVTLVGKTIFDMTEGMYDGTITSTVSAGTSTIDFDNSLDAIVTINSEETVDGVDTTMILSTEGEADGTITVSAGSVSITSEIWISKLVIGSGATVVIADGGDLTTGVNQGFKANTILKELPVLTDELVGNLAGLVVDGTLTVEDRAILTANLSVINGTVSIADGSDVDMPFAFVNGTLDIEDGASAGYLILFVNGTINGSVEPITQTVGGKQMTLGVVIAFPGSDVSAAKIYYGGSNESMADITTFYVNGAEWATVYATQDNVDVLAMLMAIDIDGVDETTAVFYSDAGMTQAIVNKDKVTALVNGVKGLTIDKGTTAFIESLFNLGRNTTIFGTGYTVGTFENVYIDMAASNVNGTITVYQGMDLYIDGKSITNFAQADDSGKVTYTLPVGQHTFSVQIDPGLTGTYEITLDGQTITGDTFTIADNAKDFQIVVTGSLSQESVVVDGGNSDSGMGLTDYLLIILVVLIVIMAIMVAMRLMRS